MKYLDFATEAEAEAYSSQLWTDTFGVQAGVVTNSTFPAVETAASRWVLLVEDESLIPVDDRADLLESVTLMYSLPA